LRFTTKRKAHLTLPVTAEIRGLLDTCDQHSDQSFVRQLWARNPQGYGRKLRTESKGADRLRVLFRKLCIANGITRRIVPHDLRRTAAVGMLEATGDVRDVQALLGHRTLASTIWYLDHDLRPVKRATLELIKTPNWRKDTKTA
jgi:integrase